MNGLALLSKLGFDVPRMGFVMRTLCAVIIAVTLAWSLGLEHPQWAGMTVWAASLPTRGQLLSKSLSRFGGTLIGSIVGVLIVYAAQGQIPLLVVMLTLWVTACLWVGHLVRSYLTYGTILAGYSASLVALVDTGHHDQILVLGIDRVLTALVGVAVAILVSWYFAQRDSQRAERGQVRSIAADVLHHLKAALQGEAAGRGGERHALLSRMAALDSSLEMRGLDAGAERRYVREVRMLLPALVSVLLWQRPEPDATRMQGMVDALDEAIGALEQGGAGDAVMPPLQRLRQLCEQNARPGGLHEHLSRFCPRLEAVLSDNEPAPEQRQHRRGQLVLHRDWLSARQASIRALTVLLMVGLVWILTGDQIGAYMLLGTSVMATLFSVREQPVSMMRDVFIGQCLAGVAALVCRWLVWPLAGSEGQQILLLIPFLLLGALLLSHRRTVTYAFDYNMVILLLLQPHFPLTGGFGYSLLTVLAVVSAPLIALLGYRFIYPVNALSRIEGLKSVMVRELQSMALNPLAPEKRERWRARIYYRMLHLVRLADLVGDQRFPAAEWGVTVLRLELAVQCLQRLRTAPDLRLTTLRAVDHALNRIAQSDHTPERVLRALDLASVRLEREARQAERAQLALARESLASNLKLFTATS